MSRFDILSTVRRRRDVLRGGMSIAAASGLGGATLIFPNASKAATDLNVQFDWLMGNGQTCHRFVSLRFALKPDNL